MRCRNSTARQGGSQWGLFALKRDKAEKKAHEREPAEKIGPNWFSAALCCSRFILARTGRGRRIETGFLGLLDFPGANDEGVAGFVHGGLPYTLSLLPYGRGRGGLHNADLQRSASNAYARPPSLASFRASIAAPRAPAVSPFGMIKMGISACSSRCAGMPTRISWMNQR